MDGWMTQNFNEIASNCEKKNSSPVFVPEFTLQSVAGRDLFPHTHNEDIAQWQSVLAWYT